MIPNDNQRQALLVSYLAGIMDGEGCISIRQQNQEGLAYNYRPSITIGMVEPKVVNIFKDLFGGNIYIENRGVQDRQVLYRWNLQKVQEVKDCLDTLLPYLLLKNDQALNTLSLINNYPHSRKLMPEELQRRKDHYLISRKLNAVGAAATTKRDDIREDEAIV